MNSEFVFALGVAVGLVIVTVAAEIFGLRSLGSLQSASSAILMLSLFACLFFRMGNAVFKRNLSAKSSFALGSASGVVQFAIAATFVAFASPNGEIAGPLAGLFLLAPILVCSFLAPLAVRRTIVGEVRQSSSI